MRVLLCGVRGSTPAPGEAFTGVGGHTSCVALSHDDGPVRLILDAGTGLRRLNASFAGSAFRGSIMLTHLHWDHVMGLPFFGAADRPDAEVALHLPDQGANAERLLARLMSPPLFPVTPGELRGEWRFEAYDEGHLELEGFTVTAREIPHKGGRTMGLRIEDGSSSIAYLPDHAPHQYGMGPRGTGELHPAACELADGVDVLLHGAQYTLDELPDRFGWGHAAADYAVHLGEHCSVGKVVLIHHEPSRTDDQVAAIHASLTESAGVPVEIGVEGTELRP